MAKSYYDAPDYLEKKYWDDEANFSKLNDTDKKYYLQTTIDVYGPELLEREFLTEAKRLNLIDHSFSTNTDNSLLTTVANVLSHIPKWLVFTLAASEALKTVCAFPKYNPISDNSNADNSNVMVWLYFSGQLIGENINRKEVQK